MISHGSVTHPPPASLAASFSTPAGRLNPQPGQTVAGEAAGGCSDPALWRDRSNPYKPARRLRGKVRSLSMPPTYAAIRFAGRCVAGMAGQDGSRRVSIDEGDGDELPAPTGRCPMSGQLAQGAGAWLALRDYARTDGARWLHAAKVALAVVLALGIAMRLELRVPRTAMVSIVIVMMHQYSGMVIARGFYRGLGMFAGSMAGLLLVVAFPQQPLPFFLSLSALLGACVVGASYFRNFQSYGFVLTGYATCIIAVPAWSDPYGVFDNVVQTVSEVAVGVTCASLVSALVLPCKVRPALLAAGDAHFDHLLDFVRQMLRADAEPEQLDGEHLKLLQERAQLETLASAVVFEDPAARQESWRLVELNHDFLDTYARLRAMHLIRRQAAERHHDHAVASIQQLFEALEQALPPPGPAATARAVQGLQRMQALGEALPAQIEQGLQQQTTAQGRDFYMTAASAMNLLLQDLSAYAANIVGLRDPALLAQHGYVRRKRPARGLLSTANRMAALAAGARAALAVALVGAAWVASGWVAGASAVIGAAITSALFAVVPQPAAASRQIFLGCLLGWSFGFAFNFLLLPRIAGFPLLAVCLGAVVMAGAFANTFPRLAVPALGFNIYFLFIGNLGNPPVYAPAAYLDLGAALLCGIAAAALAFNIFVPYASAWAARHYLRQMRRLVARTAVYGRLDNLLYRFESNLRDFVMQIALRPLDGPFNRTLMFDWAFAAMDVGRAVIQVRELSEAFPEALPVDWPRQLHDWQLAVAALFERHDAASYWQALAVTGRALTVLPAPAHYPPDDAGQAVFRMRALLYFTVLSLHDPRLPWPVRGRTAAMPA